MPGRMFERRAVYCARARFPVGWASREAAFQLTAVEDSGSNPTSLGAARAQRGSRSRAERGALLGAMIAEVDEHGYAGTSVARVLARAGLSRKALYRHFDGKDACFLAAYDEITDGSLRAMQSALEDAAGWPDGAQAAISALLEVALEHPAGLRLGTIGIAALGAHGIERRLAVSARYEQFVADTVRAALPEAGEVPRALARAVVGGVRRALYGRAGRADRDELLSLVPGLVAWAGCYFPTPKAFLASRRAADLPMASLQGGRAPGTLAPHPVLLGRRGLARGDQNASRSFVVHNQRERILDAVANLCAREGYGALSVEQIASTAAVSMNAFYEHFADKEDAFIVAYEVGHMKGQTIVEQAFAEHKDWRCGIRAAVRALLVFLASEPAFARLALLETGAAGRRASDRFHVAAGGYAAMLAPGFEHAAGSEPPAIALEAIVGAIAELCLHCVASGQTPDLPALEADATFVALAPSVGAQEAAVYAMGREKRVERSPR
jgi:AcrR family transcriptional regulator